MEEKKKARNQQLMLGGQLGGMRKEFLDESEKQLEPYKESKAVGEILDEIKGLQNGIFKERDKIGREMYEQKYSYTSVEKLLELRRKVRELKLKVDPMIDYIGTIKKAKTSVENFEKNQLKDLLSKQEELGGLLKTEKNTKLLGEVSSLIKEFEETRRGIAELSQTTMISESNRPKIQQLLNKLESQQSQADTLLKQPVDVHEESLPEIKTSRKREIRRKSAEIAAQDTDTKFLVIESIELTSKIKAIQAEVATAFQSIEKNFGELDSYPSNYVFYDVTDQHDNIPKEQFIETIRQAYKEKYQKEAKKLEQSFNSSVGSNAATMREMHDKYSEFYKRVLEGKNKVDGYVKKFKKQKEEEEEVSKLVGSIEKELENFFKKEKIQEIPETPPILVGFKGLFNTEDDPEIFKAEGLKLLSDNFKTRADFLDANYRGLKEIKTYINEIQALCNEVKGNNTNVSPKKLATLKEKEKILKDKLTNASDYLTKNKVLVDRIEKRPAEIGKEIKTIKTSNETTKAEKILAKKKKEESFETEEKLKKSHELLASKLKSHYVAEVDELTRNLSMLKEENQTGFVNSFLILIGAKSPQDTKFFDDTYENLLSVLNTSHLSPDNVVSTVRDLEKICESIKQEKSKTAGWLRDAINHMEQFVNDMTGDYKWLVESNVEFEEKLPEFHGEQTEYNMQIIAMEWKISQNKKEIENLTKVKNYMKPLVESAKQEENPVVEAVETIKTEITDTAKDISDASNAVLEDLYKNVAESKVVENIAKEGKDFLEGVNKDVDELADRGKALVDNLREGAKSFFGSFFPSPKQDSPSTPVENKPEDTKDNKEKGSPPLPTVLNK